MLISKSENPDDNELIQLLLKRQAELNSLLEITQAINRNAPDTSLFEMLDVIMRVHLKIGKMRLLVKDQEHFYCAAKFGGDFENAKEFQRICVLLQNTNTIAPLKLHTHKLVNKYEYFVPVVHNNTSIAFVLIGDFFTSPEMLSSDLNFVQTLINVIVVALENKKLFNERVQRERLQRDMELASQVQNMLVPHHLPKTDFLEVAAMYLPNQNIGGDYFDFIRISKHEFLWCIADVSGKGVSAALLMANLQASLRAWASVESDLRKLIERLNEILFVTTGGDRFITMFIGRYNEVTRELTYVNAGHNPPILVLNDEISFLTIGTTLIGSFDKLPFVNIGHQKLAGNSVIFNYTDGLLESPNEDVYVSEEQLAVVTSKYLKNSAADMNKNVLHEIQTKFKAKLNSDDITMLTIKFL